MTDMEKEQLEIFRLATPEGKFAVPVMFQTSAAKREALENLMMRRLIQLIDVGFVRAKDDEPDVMLARIFLLSDEAKGILARANSN